MNRIQISIFSRNSYAKHSSRRFEICLALNILNSLSFYISPYYVLSLYDNHFFVVYVQCAALKYLHSAVTNACRYEDYFIMIPRKKGRIPCSVTGIIYPSCFYIYRRIRTLFLAFYFRISYDIVSYNRLTRTCN